MKRTSLLQTAGLIGLMALANTATAQDDSQLVVNGDIEMVTEAAAPENIGGLKTIYSGWRFRSSELQTMQMDDFENPAGYAIDEGMESWAAVDGSEGKSCASCHEDIETSMSGVRAVYPKWNETKGEIRTLAQQINDCRTDNMGAEAWKYDGSEMTAMDRGIT